MLSNTSTEWAPWYVVPADHKWFARICVSAILAHTLMKIDPKFPVVTPEQQQTLLETKAALEAEAPDGAAADPFEEELVKEAEREESRTAKHKKKHHGDPQSAVAER
jgi:alpha-beta hydrolase superfamily lysophospholipase